MPEGLPETRARCGFHARGDFKCTRAVAIRLAIENPSPGVVGHLTSVTAVTKRVDVCTADLVGQDFTSRCFEGAGVAPVLAGWLEAGWRARMGSASLRLVSSCAARLRRARHPRPSWRQASQRPFRRTESTASRYSQPWAVARRPPDGAAWRGSRGLLPRDNENGRPRRAGRRSTGGVEELREGQLYAPPFQGAKTPLSKPSLKMTPEMQAWTFTSSMYQPSAETEASLVSRKRKRTVWPA